MSETGQRQSPPRTLLRNTAKLAVCGLSIFAIGFVIAVVGTDEPVATSHANLSWLSPFERSNTDRFTTAMERLGHGSPARYNLNGNTVFHSRNTSRKRPRQVMAEYQEEFVRQGLNDQIYTHLDAAEQDARNFDALTGGLVPLAISDERIILGGVVTRNKADTASELLENVATRKDPTDLFRAHRYIEISRAPDSRHTAIVASWSDEAFDLKRMEPGSDVAAQSFDTTVPSCPGCTRLLRFEDENPSTVERVELAFIGPQTLTETRQYYERTLANVGWQPGDFNADLGEVEQWVNTDVPNGESLVLFRNGVELTLSFLPDPRTGETLTLATYTAS